MTNCKDCHIVELLDIIAWELRRGKSFEMSLFEAKKQITEKYGGIECTR